MLKKAMILAAGVGTRLKPLTDTCPKPLVEVGGIPILEIILKRLISAGVGEVIINVYHLADQIIHFLSTRQNFGIRIEFSRETALLDTGGGLKQARFFFDGSEPFILHNSDIVTNLDLCSLWNEHRNQGNLATLFCGGRESSRKFLFDKHNLLCGWQSGPEENIIWAGPPVGGTRALPFNGIHILSPAIFPLMTETGTFSINQVYLRLAGKGEIIRAYESPGTFWRDIGRIEQLEQIRREIKEKAIVF